MAVAQQFENGMQTDEVHFGFGDNWTAFLNRLSEERIVAAERSIAVWMPVAVENSGSR
jgi:hypothetical protein